MRAVRWSPVALSDVALVMIVIATLLASCEPDTAQRSTDRTAADLAQVEAQEQLDYLLIAEVSLQAVVLQDQMRHLAAEWKEIAVQFRGATARLDAIRTSANRVAAQFATAATEYEAALATYRRVTRILVLAAASDAVGQALCSGTTNTRAFRERLRAEGQSLDGVDIDHVWPQALGGADHPLNYQALDSSLNRSLGANVLEKLSRWPLETLQGLAVSAIVALSCGR